jgi:hypothetical protein
MSGLRVELEVPFSVESLYSARCSGGRYVWNSALGKEVTFYALNLSYSEILAIKVHPDRSREGRFHHKGSARTLSDRS